MTQDEFSKISNHIPQEPGIYKYFNKAGKIIYVGKAKSIRKRVSSYFNKTQASYKTLELVKNISRIEFTIVDSEQDAFFLENSLIKQFQPKYNINLKDSKSYPFIVIKNERFPRVYLTRQPIDDGSTYIGPFTSIFRVRELLEFIKRSIPLRTCSLHLSEKNIKAGKYTIMGSGSIAISSSGKARVNSNLTADGKDYVLNDDETIKIKGKAQFIPIK